MNRCAFFQTLLGPGDLKQNGTPKEDFFGHICILFDMMWSGFMGALASKFQPYIEGGYWSWCSHKKQANLKWKGIKTKPDSYIFFFVLFWFRSPWGPFEKCEWKLFVLYYHVKGCWTRALNNEDWSDDWKKGSTSKFDSGDTYQLSGCWNFRVPDHVSLEEWSCAYFKSLLSENPFPEYVFCKASSQRQRLMERGMGRPAFQLWTKTEVRKSDS